MFHRRWTCPNLRDSDHPAIKNTQRLIPRAVADVEDNAAFWLGWILTGSMVNPISLILGFLSLLFIPGLALVGLGLVVLSLL